MNLREQALDRVKPIIENLNEPGRLDPASIPEDALQISVALILVLADVSQQLEGIKELMKAHHEFA